MEVEGSGSELCQW